MRRACTAAILVFEFVLFLLRRLMRMAINPTSLVRVGIPQTSYVVPRRRDTRAARGRVGVPAHINVAALTRTMVALRPAVMAPSRASTAAFVQSSCHLHGHDVRRPGVRLLL